LTPKHQDSANLHWKAAQWYWACLCIDVFAFYKCLQISSFIEHSDKSLTEFMLIAFVEKVSITCSNCPALTWCLERFPTHGCQFILLLSQTGSLCVYLCLNSRHHISPKLEIQTKLINNELGAEQALWNKSNVLIPCIYKEKIWVDVSTKQVAPLFFCLGNEIEFYFYEFDIIFLYALCIVNCSIS
jgi:hypothetical protein